MFNIGVLLNFYVAAQIMLTVSLQLEEAGKVSIARKAGDILFAFLFQICIFNVNHETSYYIFSINPNLGYTWSVECARGLSSWGSCYALWGQEDCGWSSLISLSQDEISFLVLSSTLKWWRRWRCQFTWTPSNITQMIFIYRLHRNIILMQLY